MVIFNLHHGQMRCRAAQGTNDYQMVHIAKRPMGKLQMGSIRDVGKSPVEYVADQWGNIEVEFPAHLGAMEGLGYPIVNSAWTSGMGSPVWDQLIWPDRFTPHLSRPGSAYDRKILEGLKRRLNP